MRPRLRAWKNVAVSATMRRVRPEWVPRPHAAHLITTYRCNLKCLGCGSWQVKDHADLSTEEWLTVFRQLRSLDVVKLLGGEPFVRNDMQALMEGVRDIIDPYILQLTTNGMLTKRAVDAVRAVGWPGLQLRISVDGTEKTHDRMRGVPGSWKLVNRTVQEMAALQPQLGFKFGINFAVTDELLVPLGAAVFPAAALLNHSCAPNCALGYHLRQRTIATMSLHQLETTAMSHIYYMFAIYFRTRLPYLLTGAGTRCVPGCGRC